ncbi:Creb/atf bzip transcription factor [Plakobranchus ocellatus]|uniref:Creb/atf bzip transcription factor n=1 Tax=Plakobranchus ocellatus TaxID=259542 RepID=A0AAV3ZKY1_9GAST|nr:Creb/atf bzip transcription factor [Plakobranchus ocellatus]
MDFPEISFDTYDSWDAIPLPESHEYESSNIDSNMAQAVFEDVCFSDNAPEKKKTNDLGFDKISIDSTANFVIDPLTGISTTHSLEQPNCFTSSNAPGSESSSMSAVLKLGTYSGSKRKPAILVVNDNSVSSSGRRGPPGGDPNSKNAIAARDNRLKKKKYIADLENTVRELQSENDQLRKETEIKKQSMISLQLEVQYLKNVIANQSTLSALLKSVSQTPGINLSASISQPSASQHQNTLPLEVSSEALPINNYWCNSTHNLCFCYNGTSLGRANNNTGRKQIKIVSPISHNASHVRRVKASLPHALAVC